MRQRNRSRRSRRSQRTNQTIGRKRSAPEATLPRGRDRFSGSLSTRCRQEFAESVRRRGGDLFLVGGVRQLTKDNYEYSASVLDEIRSEKVRFEAIPFFGENPAGPCLIGIWARCTCTAFSEGRLCKHLWALILAVDAAGWGSALPAGPVEFEYGGFEPDADEEVEEVDPFAWQKEIRQLQEVAGKNRVPHPRPIREAIYGLDVKRTQRIGEIVLNVFFREKQETGEWGAYRAKAVAAQELYLFHDLADREVLGALLLGGLSIASEPGDVLDRPVVSGVLRGLGTMNLLERAASAGRLFLYSEGPYPVGTSGLDGFSLDKARSPLRFDDGPPWEIELEIQKKGDRHLEMKGNLVRSPPEERVSLEEPLLLVDSGSHPGTVVFSDRVSRLKPGSSFSWSESIRQGKLPLIPLEHADKLVETMYSTPGTPRLRWPESFAWQIHHLNPETRLIIDGSRRRDGRWPVDLRFGYGPREVSPFDTVAVLLDSEARRIIPRQPDAEADSYQQFKAMVGVSEAGLHDAFPYLCEGEHFLPMVKACLAKGWSVMASGRPLKTASAANIRVTSGIDWFDLQGAVSFGQETVLLPNLLEALEQQRNLVPLGDGSFGILPEDWLSRYQGLSQLGMAGEESIRFTQAQGPLLASYLVNLSRVEETSTPGMEGVTALKWDSQFQKLRESVNSWTGQESWAPGCGFKGKLRRYQSQGLGWLHFVQRLGSGGILADDMGLGKTVQVLAHLSRDYESARQNPEDRRPSLIVVPKSLLFNWRDEAARFTPDLKVMVHAGATRHLNLSEMTAQDLLLVTYATLSRDIERFRAMDFHYVICDEAQAIKNPDSLAHQACRQLKGRYRLAMTGTPVENSAHDLVAILDFTSPGLLGKRVRERLAAASSGSRLAGASASAGELDRLAQALKPFVLRRTKTQVLKALPQKAESILHCDLSSSERRQYNALKEHYRVRLQGEFKEHGLARSKIVVLEALLRLRQAACHPGLLDKKKRNASSTKLEILLERVQSLLREGHKALVFSQFTQLLDIVEGVMERAGVPYDRLDGQTPLAERRHLVERFQNHPDPRLFLISLKAGGVGLNLTAADYVFLLDPWWNPAVESQAIDRSHRIGQKNKVMAYRLIARGTVEEKIIELQKKKKDVAEALISADASLLKRLTPEDVELLLS